MHLVEIVIVISSNKTHMPKIRIPPGKIYTTLVVGNVYAFKPGKILANTESSICMKVMWTSKSAGMKIRPPQVVFFIKGINYSKVQNIDLSNLRYYGEIKIHTVKVFPTRIMREIIYADKDNKENIYLGIGMFLDQREEKHFVGLYVRGDYHLETPSYYTRKPEEWRTWAEFHMPFDFLENLKQILISALENKCANETQEIKDLILCIEIPHKKINYLISRIDKALEEGIKMPAVSYLIPLKDTRFLESALNLLGVPISEQRKSCDRIIQELPKRMAKYATPEERQIAYLKERKQRHEIAQFFEERVIADIIDRIKRVKSDLTIKYEPFGIDKIANKPVIIDEAEKGRPDFKIIIQLNGKILEKFVEIKIKALPHVKEAAWYLDQYVYDQLIAFCEKYHVNPEDVVVAFAYNPNLHEDFEKRSFCQEHWCYCIITLREIQENVEKCKYSIYGEGYGAPL